MVKQPTTKSHVYQVSIQPVLIRSVAGRLLRTMSECPRKVTTFYTPFTLFSNDFQHFSSDGGLHPIAKDGSLLTLTHTISSTKGGQADKRVLAGEPVLMQIVIWRVN